MPEPKKAVSAFSKKPTSLEVAAGSAAEFVAETAKVGAKVKWQRDGKEVAAGGRVSVQAEGSRHTLKVDAAAAEDAGSYAVVCGTSKVKFELKVKAAAAAVEEAATPVAAPAAMDASPAPAEANGAPDQSATAAANANGAPASDGDAPAPELNPEDMLTGEALVMARKLSLARCNTPEVAEGERRQELTGLFLEKPVSTVINMGGDAMFVAKVHAESLSKKPSVKWFKGKWMDLASKAGKHLQFKEMYDRNTKDFTFEMKVIAAKENFSGSYRCEVSMKDKIDSCPFDITVEARDSAQVLDIRQAFRRSSVMGDDAGELDFSALLKKRELKEVQETGPDEDVFNLLKSANPHDYEKIAFQHGITDLRGMLKRLRRMKAEKTKSAAFLKKLDPAYQVDKSSKARFVVEMNDPNAEVKWLKNGQEIRQSGKYIMETKGNQRILVIKNCNLADDAAYQVMVGDEKCSTELFVKEPPVVITQGLDDHSALVGERVEMMCEVSEEGAAVKWMKDGVELTREETFKYRFKKDGTRHCLIINDATKEDAGRYSVRTNGGESMAELHVEEKQLEVLQSIADLTIKAQEQAVFKCEVSDEKVTGRWFKNGVEVIPTPRINATHVGRIHKLTIDSVTEADEGDYTFVPDGYAISLSAKLNMLEVKIDYVPRQEPPKIHLETSDKMQQNTIVVVAGNKLRLDVPITGDPAPKVIWQRGDQGICTIAGRVRVESFPDHSTFVIDCAERGDQGEYSITVQNEAGEDKADMHIKVVDVPDPPLAPTIGNVGEDWCFAKWSPPEYDGGLPILGYVIERKKKQSYRWMRLNFDLWKELEFEAKRMIEGVSYEMRIYAVNAIGMSLPSSPSRPFVPIAPTGEPTNVSVEDVTDTTVTLKWRAPERIGAAGLDGYRIEYRKEGTEEWVVANPDHLTERTGYTVKGLPMGEKLNFRVTAWNAAGPSKPGLTNQAVIVREVVERPKIQMPRNLRQVYIKRVGETINVLIPFLGKPKPKATWKKDGEPVDIKHVSVRNSDTDSILFIRKCTRADSGKYELSVQIDNLEDKAILELQVIEKPGPPLAMKILDIWGFNVNLEWKLPTDNGNSEITGYTVQKADKKTMEWFTMVEHYRRTSYTASDLIMGNDYFFRVFAENMCGLSEEAGNTKNSAYIQKTGSTYKRPPYQEHDFMEAPKFTHPLVDLVAVAGYNATLSCCIRGNPRPKIIWFKNKVNLQEDPRYRMFGHQGVCTLEIRKPGPYDGGVYTCRAVNSLGEAEAECKLEVKVAQELARG
ncbi:myosin-binding protein C, slow-type isoform X2 [Lampetra planeri]